MTAEIAVMNRNAIALAADSALTIGPDSRRKVFTSAEKIFALSKYEPVAAMVFGNANLMGIPWEAIIKLYRKNLGKRKFPLIEDYAKDILKFLHEHEKLFPEKLQAEYFKYRMYSCLRGVAKTIREAIEEKGLLVTDEERRAIVSTTIQGDFELWNKEEFLKSASEKEASGIREKFESDAIEMIGQEFADFKITDDERELLLKMVPLAALKCPGGIEFGVAAGLVIAGFGDEAFFPALRSFSINGIFAGHLNFSQDEDADIGSDLEAQIIPFAQDDQVYSFTHGVDRNYQRRMEMATRSVLERLPNVVLDSADFITDEQKKKLREMLGVGLDPGWKAFVDEMRKTRLEGFYWPILDLVASLPKGELAAIAESMVNLTSLRRKMSRGTETVAGPIDVAIISKGDGLVWIKRKHYFDAALNHQFFANYYRERSEADVISK